MVTYWNFDEMFRLPKDMRPILEMMSRIFEVEGDENDVKSFECPRTWIDIGIYMVSPMSGPNHRFDRQLSKTGLVSFGGCVDVSWARNKALAAHFCVEDYDRYALIKAQVILKCHATMQCCYERRLPRVLSVLILDFVYLHVPHEWLPR